MTESLRYKTAANLSYNLVARLFVFALSSATGIILARNLTSSDYGIVGFAMIFIEFLQRFNDFGITSSVVQKENIKEKELYTAFLLKIIFGFLMFSLSFALGWVSQITFNDPAVKWVIVVLAANLFLDSLGFLPTTILTRELKFKRLTIPQIGARVVATVVALTTVYMGFRYWSIVLSNVAANLTTVAIVWVLCPIPLKFRWDSNAAMEQLKFGSNLLFAGLMVLVLHNAGNFTIGAVTGAAALGYYSIALNWGCKVPGFISDAIGNILLSTFSRVQRDAERLNRGYLTMLEYVSFTAILFNILILIASKELLTLVLGANTGKWLPALLSLHILCIYGAFRALLEPVKSLIIAIGRPSLILKSNAIVAVLQVLCLYPALVSFDIAGVAVVVTLSYSLQYLIYFPAMQREIDLPFSSIFRSIRPALLSGWALATFGCVIDLFMSTSWFSLAVKLILGSILYIALYGIITKWKILKESREIIGAILLKPGDSEVTPN
ncbi:MAG: lipopolysaccharide biosynthesis protein [Deltaproteobacteria bacterium]|nr:lipopolysaccharide biosynthesis protein [Deltaproteobacteria bacterium]